MPAVNVIFDPATKLLNSKSTPVFCLKTPSPDPLLDAVVITADGRVGLFVKD